MTDVSDRVRSLLELAEGYLAEAEDGRILWRQEATEMCEGVVALAQEWEAMRAALNETREALVFARIGVGGAAGELIDRALALSSRAALSAGVSPQPKDLS